MRYSLKEFFLREDDEPLGEHQDPTEPVDAGSTIWSDPTQPAHVKKFSSKGGVLSVDLCEMFGEGYVDEMGGKGSGRPKGSKNKPRDPNITPGRSVDPKDLPDELDDIDIDTSDFDEPGNIDQSDITGFGAAQHQPDQPADPRGFEPPDNTFSRGEDDFGDDLSWLDDPNLGAGFSVPTQDPSAPKPAREPPMAKAGYEGPWQASPEFDDAVKGYDFSSPETKDKGQFWKDVGEYGETMDWDELKDAEPEIASDIEKEFPDLSTGPSFFTKDDAGDVVARIRGARYKWDVANRDWIPLDDGETPSGEF